MINNKRKFKDINFTKENLINLFHLPLQLAAKHIGICPTNFKKYCRKVGIHRWPNRKIKSVNNKIQEYQIQINKDSNIESVEKIKKNIEILENVKKNIAENSFIDSFESVDTQENNTVFQPINKIILKKSLNINDILLLRTDFFDSYENIRNFTIIEKNVSYTVQLGMIITCTCGYDIKRYACDHLSFIMKKLFKLNTINKSMTINDFIFLESCYNNNVNIYDCSMCYDSIINSDYIYYFQKYQSYGHIGCTKQCLNVIKKTSPITQFQNFMNNLLFTKISCKQSIDPDSNKRIKINDKSEIQSINLIL